jgi:hypothetical protein
MLTSANSTALTCSICTQAEDYCEIENVSDEPISQFFPTGYNQLIFPNPALSSFFSKQDTKLFKCPDCHHYFLYNQWTPGGSEDFQRSYVHEAYKKLSPLEVHTQLHEAWATAERFAKEFGGSFEKEYPGLKKGFQSELKELKKWSKEIIIEAVLWVQNRHAYSDNLKAIYERFGYPRATISKIIQETRAKEDEVAECYLSIIQDYLKNITKVLDYQEVIQTIIGLFQEDSAKIRRGVKDVIISSSKAKRNIHKTVIVDTISSFTFSCQEWDELRETICQNS